MAALAVAVALVASCRVDASVKIKVAENGGGEVTVLVVLDRDATDLLEDSGEAATKRLRVDDLKEAGWQVTGPRRDSQGQLTIEAKKSFADPSSLPGVIKEIAGSKGVLREVSLDRTQEFMKTRYEARGALVRDGALSGFSEDKELLAALTEREVDVVDLQAKLDEWLADSDLTLIVELPGAAPHKFAADKSGAQAWSATSSTKSYARLAWAILAGVLSILALLLATAERRKRRRRRSQPLRMYGR